MSNIDTFLRMVRESDNIVFFGGSGCLDGERNPGFSQCGWTLQSEIQLAARDDFEPFLLY